MNFDIAPPTHAQRWAGVELSEKDIDVARKDCVKAFYDAAEQAEQGRYLAICIHGEAVFYYDFPYGLIPGHIYSESGVDEFMISTCCEYHFDEMFKEEE